MYSVSNGQLERPKSKVPSSGLLQTKMDRWLEQLKPPIVVVALHRQGVCPRLTEIAASPGSKLNIIVGTSNIVGYKLGHSPPKGFISSNGIAWVKTEQTGELLDHRVLQAGTLTVPKGRHPPRAAILKDLELTRSQAWRREVK